MKNEHYLNLCKLAVKGSNNFSDDDLDHFTSNFIASAYPIQQDHLFKNMYKSIDQLVHIHTHAIQTVGVISTIHKCTIYQNKQKLEDTIFACFEVLQFDIEHDIIMSKKLSSLLSFAFSLSFLNSTNLNIITPAPSNEKLMLVSIFNDKLQNTATATDKELLDMWKKIWQLSCMTMPDESTIYDCLSYQKHSMELANN